MPPIAVTQRPLLAALRVAGRLLSKVPLSCDLNVVIAGATAQPQGVLQVAGWIPDC